MPEMTYAVLEEAPPRRSGDYAVRPIAPEDMEPIRRWRNAQLPVLRQKEPISATDQERYFEAAVWPTFADPAPPQVLVTLLHGDEAIGYGGLTNLDWQARRAELSFLVSPERAADPDCYERDFRAFLELVVDGVAFADLGLHRVYSEIHDIRPHHVSILEDHGFVLEGRLRDHVRIDERFVDSLMYGYLAS
jgi:RimJ/RimL family protein N-acetyltransferase